MALMSPELELMIFMTPIFTDKAELALEVFKCVISVYCIYKCGRHLRDGCGHHTEFGERATHS